MQPMKRLLLISALTLFTVLIVHAQDITGDTRWYYFTDKAGNGFSTDRPGEFLSERSVHRRAWQSLAVDAADLPVSSHYLDSLAKMDLTIRHVSRWLNGVLVQSDNIALIDTLESLSFLDTVPWQPTDPDPHYPGPPPGNRFAEKLKDPPSFDYGYSRGQLAMMGVDYLHQKGYTGRGVYIAVLDGGFTGMDTLPAFDSLFTTGRIAGQRNYVDRQQSVFNRSNHGMMVSSAIAANWPGNLTGTAPHASLLLGVSENTDSETKIEELAWIEAAEWADSAGVDIINTSLGYSVFDDSTTNYSYQDMDGQTTFISRAASMLASRGMLGVNSAGNEGSDEWYYITAPADASGILTVGAVDTTRKIASFSSRGPTYDHRIKPEVTAVGYLTALQGSSGSAVRGFGTSFSAPLVSGAVASLWQAYPGMNVPQLIRAVVESASQYRYPDATYGYGIPDVGRAFHAITPVEIIRPHSGLKTYPNPCDAMVYVELPGEMRGHYQVNLFDLQGRTVLSLYRDLPGQIDLPATMTPGMYVLEVHQPGKTQRFRTRMIKQ